MVDLAWRDSEAHLAQFKPHITQSFAARSASTAVSCSLSASWRRRAAERSPICCSASIPATRSTPSAAQIASFVRMENLKLGIVGAI